MLESEFQNKLIQSLMMRERKSGLIQKMRFLVRRRKR